MSCFSINIQQGSYFKRVPLIKKINYFIRKLSVFIKKEIIYLKTGAPFIYIKNTLVLHSGKLRKG